MTLHIGLNGGTDRGYLRVRNAYPAGNRSVREHCHSGRVETDGRDDRILIY